MKIHAYTIKGSKSADVELPKNLVEKPNLALLAQAIRVYEDNTHFGLAKVKTRSDVQASTRKIYRQKGTGRARHGAVSAPIFVGGGKSHGPKGIKRVLELPKKMRLKALAIAVSVKAKDGKVVAVSDFSKLAKTKEANAMLNAVRKAESVKDSAKVTVFVSDTNKESWKFLRNLENVNPVPFRLMNAYNVYRGGFVVIDADNFEKPKTVKKMAKTAKKTTVKAKKTIK